VSDIEDKRARKRAALQRAEDERRAREEAERKRTVDAAQRVQEEEERKKREENEKQEHARRDAAAAAATKQAVAAQQNAAAVSAAAAAAAASVAMPAGAESQHPGVVPTETPMRQSSLPIVRQDLTPQQPQHRAPNSQAPSQAGPSQPLKAASPAPAVLHSQRVASQAHHATAAPSHVPTAPEHSLPMQQMTAFPHHQKEQQHWQALFQQRMQQRKTSAGTVPVAVAASSAAVPWPRPATQVMSGSAQDSAGAVGARPVAVGPAGIFAAAGRPRPMDAPSFPNQPPSDQTRVRTIANLLQGRPAPTSTPPLTYTQQQQQQNFPGHLQQQTQPSTGQPAQQRPQQQQEAPNLR
jgi:hypothetical protein